MRQFLVLPVLMIWAVAGAMADTITCSAGSGSACPGLGAIFASHTSFTYDDVNHWGLDAEPAPAGPGHVSLGDTWSSAWLHTTSGGLAVGAAGVTSRLEGSLNTNTGNFPFSSYEVFGRFGDGNLILNPGAASMAILFGSSINGLGFYLSTQDLSQLSVDVTAYDFVNGEYVELFKYASSVAPGGGPCWQRQPEGVNHGFFTAPAPCTGAPPPGLDVGAIAGILGAGTNDYYLWTDPNAAPFFGIQSSALNIRKVVVSTNDQSFFIGDLYVDTSVIPNPPVPEPGVGLLIGGGLAALAAAYRRRNAKS